MDNVHTPDHYRGEIEAIEVIEGIIGTTGGASAFLLGNVLKYALRAGRKGDAKEDIAKARNYAHRLLTGEWEQ